MRSRAEHWSWWLGDLTIVAIVGLLPVIQFMDANDYFKFRYGFDTQLLALILLAFALVP